MNADETLEDRLDRLVSEYADLRQRGQVPDRDVILAEVPEGRRPSLRRLLDLIDAGTTESVTAPLGPGVELGGYRIDALLGRGGMATVFRATDPSLRREVALKVLRPGLAMDPRHVERFRREASAIARLTHPNVVSVFEVGFDRGHHYLSMELLTGPSLADVIARVSARRTGRDLADAAGIPTVGGEHETFEQAVARLLAAAADGVMAAHARGIVHRDLKPSNILVHADGRAMVADFGLAKSEGDLALSLTGAPIGTPYYMSPEQVVATAGEVDARTDVYSLGVTLYECLSGDRPFQGGNALEVFDAIRGTSPPPLSAVAPGCSSDALEVVARAMARRPSDRYPDVGALREDLARLAGGLPTRARSESGGLTRRLAAGLRARAQGQHYEYRSTRTLLGLPLVHVLLPGRLDRRRARAARGWLAIGPVALGVLAFGNVACGVFALGVLSVGVLAFGGACAVGAAALGGGFAGGGVAFGGTAGGYAAVGGYAAGRYAIGGLAHGGAVVSGERVDREALEWFDRHAPIVWRILPAEARDQLRRRAVSAPSEAPPTRRSAGVPLSPPEAALPRLDRNADARRS